MGLSTVESALRARRLKWWQDIMAATGEHTQLLAALFGTMEREVRDGRVLGPTPWVCQLTIDLEEYGATTQQWGMARGKLTQQVKGIGGTVLLRKDWRVRYRGINHEAVKSYMITRDRKERETGVQDNDEVCGVVGGRSSVSICRGQTSVGGAQSDYTWPT